MLGPGQPWPAEGIQPGSMRSSTPLPPHPSESAHELPTGDIVGIAIAAVAIAAVAIAVLCVTFCHLIHRSSLQNCTMRQHRRSEPIGPHEWSAVAGPWSPIWPHSLDTAAGQNVETQGVSCSGEKEFERHPIELTFNQRIAFELVGDQPPVSELGPYR
jgi:hypothetical protein